MQLSRDLDCQYKTASVLVHKLHEAMATEVHTGEMLESHVEIDGAYFGGHIRPENAKADRKDRRWKRHQTGKRGVVIAMREREGRTPPFVGQSEAKGVALANENVSRMSTMSADEASHRDELHMGDHVDRVNHSQTYCDHGQHTNMVESWFSRLRRMVSGQHHHAAQLQSCQSLRYALSQNLMGEVWPIYSNLARNIPVGQPSALHGPYDPTRHEPAWRGI